MSQAVVRTRFTRANLSEVFQVPSGIHCAYKEVAIAIDIQVLV